MIASIVNNVEGNVLGKESTVLSKGLLVEIGLNVRKANPVQNKFLFNRPNRNVYGKKRRKCKKKVKPCYVCANWGHSGNSCPQVCSVCSKKESDNNVEEDHSSIFCLKCGSTGHAMFSCTNDYDPEDLKGIQCYICMEFGHLCCAKNTADGPSEASCYNCGQSRHHGFECTKMNVAAKYLQPGSICFKCQKTVDAPKRGELDRKPTSSETSTVEKHFVLNNSINVKFLRAQTLELANISTSAETTLLGKDEVFDKFVKAREMDDKSSLAETIMVGIDAVPSNFVKAGEKVSESTSAETSTVTNDAVPDKSIQRKSRNARRKERRHKRKPVIPIANVVQSLPTMSMIGFNTPRFGQYYGNPGSNIWLPPPTPAVTNSFVNSPAFNQSSYTRTELNVWAPPPAAAARNYLEISPAVNQSSYLEISAPATHVPPNHSPPRGLLHHHIFHQGPQIPGPPQNMIQLPLQNFIPQIRIHDPQSFFDSRTGISQQPELPLHVSNHGISASFPQHQLSSHRSWVAPPGWKP